MHILNTNLQDSYNLQDNKQVLQEHIPMLRLKSKHRLWLSWLCYGHSKAVTARTATTQPELQLSHKKSFHGASTATYPTSTLPHCYVPAHMHSDLTWWEYRKPLTTQAVIWHNQSCSFKFNTKKEVPHGQGSYHALRVLAPQQDWISN